MQHSPFQQELLGSLVRYLYVGIMLPITTLIDYCDCLLLVQFNHCQQVAYLIVTKQH